MEQYLSAFKAVADALTEGLIVADNTGKMVVYNSEAERIMGVGITDQPADQWSEVYGIYNGNGGKLPHEKVPLVRALNGEIVRNEDVFCRNPNIPDGIWVRCNAKPLYQDGTLTGAALTFTEVTADKAKAEVLERRFQAWFHTTPDLIAVVGSDGLFTELVPGLDVKPHIAVKDIIGKHILEVGDPELARIGWEKSKEAMRTGRMQVFEYQQPAVPGVEFEARYIPTGPDEVLIKVRDITDWVRNRGLLEERVAARTAELQASNDELRQFAYAASHDLREPLGKIKAFGNRLQEKYGDKLDDKGFEYLNVMQNAADRMLGLIDDLLEYSRVGRIEQDPERLNLNALVREVVDLFSERLDDATIEVSPLPTICGDRHQFFTLFQNLIGNSLKFRCPERPTVVKVSSDEDEAFFILKVEDNGIGFEPEYAERIFQIFERLHTRFNYPGTGIGLALCRKIIERHGGYIRGEGRPGEGATFLVGLPKESCDACSA